MTTTEFVTPIGSSLPDKSDSPAVHEVWELLKNANLLHQCPSLTSDTLRCAHDAVKEGKGLVEGDRSFSAFTKPEPACRAADRNTCAINTGHLTQDDRVMLIFTTLLLNWKCGIVTIIVTPPKSSLGDMLAKLLERLPEDIQPPLVNLNPSGRKCHTLSRDAQVNKVKKCCAIVASSTWQHFEAARDFLTQYKATRNRYKGWGLILDGGKEFINARMGKGTQAEAARSAFKDCLLMPSGENSAPFFTMDVTLSSDEDAGTDWSLSEIEESKKFCQQEIL